MKSVRLLVATGACSLLLLASSASAAPAVHVQAKPTTVAAAHKTHAKADPRAARAHGHKRPAHHDATMDWPQLG
jgi:hypothetical protein